MQNLRSDEDTDDEDQPRKVVPVWAKGNALRSALMRQTYMAPDLDQIFTMVEMPRLELMFQHQRKRFFKRTSSAVWDSRPMSNNLT